MEKSIALEMFVSWKGLVFSLFLVIFLTAYCYFLRLKDCPKKQKSLYFFLRLIFLFLFALAGLGLKWEQSRWEKEERHIILLKDISNSMDILDMGGKSRKEVCDEILTKNHDLLNQIKESFHFSQYAFAKGIRDQRKDFGHTAIGRALEDSTKRVEANKILAILLLSDGQNNDGPHPLNVIEGLGKVPIYSIGLGEPKKEEAKHFDSQGRDIIAPKEGLMGHGIPILGEFFFQGLKGKSIQIQLLVNGKILKSKRITPSANRVIERISFYHTFQSFGLAKISLRAKPLANEVSYKNNTVSTFIRIIPKGVSILYLARFPRWELKFLRRALQEEKGIYLDIRLIGSSGFRPPPGFDWKKFQAVILDNLEPNSLNFTDWRKILESVSQHRMGLLILSGSILPENFYRTSLGPILPFLRRGTYYSPRKVSPVPSRRNSLHPILRIHSTSSKILDNIKLWSSLPPWKGMIRSIFPKGNSEVLLMDSYSKNPILIINPNAGLGRTAIMAAENTWTWVLGHDKGKEYHKRFWNNLLLWLVQKKQEGKIKLLVKPEKFRIKLGKTNSLVAQILGRKTLFSKITLNGEVILPNGEKMPLTFQQVERNFESSLRPSMVGDYHIQVKAYQGRSLLGSAKTAFHAYVENRELEKIWANHDLLKQISQTSGGKFFPPSQFRQLLESLLKKPKEIMVKVEENKTPWIPESTIFILLCLFLGMEWFFRRKQGLL